MSHNNGILSSDDESINNNNNDGNESSDSSTNSSPEPEKKQKKTFEEEVDGYITLYNEMVEILNTASMKEFPKLFSKFTKDGEKFLSKLNKLHQKSSNKKKRKNTENTGKSGFNKPTIVPKEFIKYLDLDSDTEMTRPQLVKILNQKFSDDGFKVDGQVCISSKKIAKIFGVSKDHTFHPKDYHKFIATYYNNSKNAASSEA